MAPSFEYEASFAGIPFVLDTAKIVRLKQEVYEGQEGGNAKWLPARKYQSEGSLIDELNRILAFNYLNDFQPTTTYTGRNVSNLARPYTADLPPSRVKIGEFFYPNGASRWSVLRFLATSSMVKAMVEAALPEDSQPLAKMLKIECQPVGPTESNFTVETNMYLLPPRPMAQHGGGYDGLYLVTLVDDRYYWQWKPVTLHADQITEWDDLIHQCATALGIQLQFSDIDPVYLQPELDSQLWVNFENAAQLLDAIAWNVGATVVRHLNNQYILETKSSSLDVVNTNRGQASTLVTIAGGDMFYSGTQLPVGNLTQVKTAIVPNVVNVTFPSYILPADNQYAQNSPDSVPHLVNSRYNNQRQSAWMEDSYGTVYNVPVPIASGPMPQVEGIVGINAHTLHCTAKALFSGEISVGNSGSAINHSGLCALSMQLANDYWFYQAASALDEVYPGIYAWTPEGLNDIIWTYSADRRLASTRVMRAEWNLMVREFQHSTPPPYADIGCFTDTPRGVGGQSVAQSIRDSFSGLISTTVSTNFSSGQSSIFFDKLDNFPTQNRWFGAVNSGKGDFEIVMFEGTSGGALAGLVDIVQRGFGGTVQTAHYTASGIINIDQIQGNHTFGVNLTTYEKMMFVYPAEYSSGGLQGVHVVPQTQTVYVGAGSGTFATSGTGGLPAGIQGLDHWSGVVNSYDATMSGQEVWPSQENIWVIERNGLTLTSGKRYDGQLVGYSASGPIAPVYAVNEANPPQKQTIKDSYSGAIAITQLNADMLSGDMSAVFLRNDYFPTQNRWIGLVESEKILFEGTSGGVFVGVAARSYANTQASKHNSGQLVSQIVPDCTSGYDLLTTEKMMWVYPQEISGNIIGANIVPQLQTVINLNGSGVLINEIMHWSGLVETYDASLHSGHQYSVAEAIWVVERNGFNLVSGMRYDGQIVGYSASGKVAPIYAVNQYEYTPGNLSTVRDSYNLSIATTTLNQNMLSGDSTAVFLRDDYFPTQNRWIGLIGTEKILFEGTSGGVSIGMAVRGYANTNQVAHSIGATVAQVHPDITSGFTLLTAEKMQFIYPQETSGTVVGANIVPQVQTVVNLNSSGVLINNIMHWSGLVNTYDPSMTSGSQFPVAEAIWIVERNGNNLTSGTYYEGQIVGYSASGTVAPIYAVNQATATPSFIVQDTRYCSRMTSSLTSGGTTVTVESSALFPKTNGYYINVDSEAMLVTAGASGNSWTVSRGQLGTSQSAHQSWVQVCQPFPAINVQLVGGINSSVTSITVNGVGNFPTYGKFFILIDSEVMLVTDGAGSTSWTVVRGFNSTAASHTGGATVYQALPDTVTGVDQIIFDDMAFVQPGVNDGKTVAVHHEVDQVVRIVSSTPNGNGFYDAFLQKYDSVNRKWDDDIAIWVRDVNT